MATTYLTPTSSTSTPTLRPGIDLDPNWTSYQPGSLNWADAQYARATDYWKQQAEDTGLSWEDFNDKGMGAQYGYVPGVRGYAGPGADATPYHDTTFGITTAPGKGSYFAGQGGEFMGFGRSGYTPGTEPAGFAASAAGGAQSPQSAAMTSDAAGGGGPTGAATSLLTSDAAGGGGPPTGASGSLLTAAGAQPAAANNGATGGGVSGGLTQQLPSEVLQQLMTDPNARYNDANGNVYYGNWSQDSADEMGVMQKGQFLGNIVGHANPSGANESTQLPMGLYNASGALTGTGTTGVKNDIYDTIGQAMFAGIAAAGLGQVLGAVGGSPTATGPDFSTGFTDTGTAGGAADTGYAGTAAVQSPGSTMLSGPTSVNADYSLTGVQTGTIEGNAAQGLNSAARSGTGLNMPTTPNMETMGGGQGLTTTGSQVLGDQGSFINAPEYQLPDAAQQTISESGIYSPDHPYTPDLGDSNSPINGGTNPWPATPTTTGPIDWIKGLIDGILPGGGGGSILPTLVNTLLTPNQNTPAYTPPQPEVGVGVSPGESAAASAQGGASGSMAGVAGTLLTSKDTFGYGRPFR